MAEPYGLSEFPPEFVALNESRIAAITSVRELMVLIQREAPELHRTIDRHLGPVWGFINNSMQYADDQRRITAREVEKYHQMIEKWEDEHGR